MRTRSATPFLSAFALVALAACSSGDSSGDTTDSATCGSNPNCVDSGSTGDVSGDVVGIYFVDATSGSRGPTTGVDWWGQSIPNGTGVWFVVTSKSDGPGLFVGSMDATAKVTWKGNEQGTHCGDGFADTLGGIALD